MARRESYRKDLFAAVRALVPRIELEAEGWFVVAGKRQDGGWRIFVGQDLSICFDPQGRLRRVYDHGILYRAEKGQGLSLLWRARTHDPAILRSKILSREEKTVFLETLRDILHELLRDIQLHTLRSNRAIPPNEGSRLLDELGKCLERFSSRSIEVSEGMTRSHFGQSAIG